MAIKSKTPERAAPGLTETRHEIALNARINRRPARAGQADKTSIHTWLFALRDLYGALERSVDAADREDVYDLLAALDEAKAAAFALSRAREGSQ
jgi:hypothetical protein